MQTIHSEEQEQEETRDPKNSAAAQNATRVQRTAHVRALIDRLMSTRIEADDHFGLAVLRADGGTSLRFDVLLELKALRARLASEPLETLLRTTQSVSVDDVAIGRGVLLLAGFDADELTDGVVQEIIALAPVLLELGREARGDAR